MVESGANSFPIFYKQPQGESKIEAEVTVLDRYNSMIFQRALGKCAASIDQHFNF
jgi:hypothetical protein